MITVNFAVQALHRWNGPMRLLPWSEMEDYVAEGADVSGQNSGDNADVPEHLTRDTLTFHHKKADPELPPTLAQELRRRPQWFASRAFPAEVGDAILRDARIWHAGSPNLSREARYLPSVEFASRELVAHFTHFTNPPWPKKALPATFAKAMSGQARDRCAAIIAGMDDDYLKLDAFDWVKWEVGFPARRNHFLPGGHLGPEQADAVSLRACLETLSPQVGRAAGVGVCLSDEQREWLRSRLAELTADKAADNAGLTSEVNRECSAQPMHVGLLASTLLAALAQGPLGHVYTDTARLEHGSCSDHTVSALAGQLLILLGSERPLLLEGRTDDRDEVSERNVRRRIGD